MTNPKLSPACMAVVLRYAQRRGISKNKINEFIDPTLDLDRYRLPDADKAEVRLQAAINNGERVAIFGDYDADGITSVAILLRFFQECTTLQPKWKLPHRKHDHYGLDRAMAQKLATEFRPALLLCADNGSNSKGAISWLRSQGIDTIVLDHHPVTTLADDSVAMVNPKAHSESPSGDLTSLCAAGLALVFCNHLAQAWHCEVRWDRTTATMLAGIGTLADAVPMSETNRAIAKTMLLLINSPSATARCCGLKALLSRDGQRLTQRRIQFEVVPPLNALGRLDAADPGVELLTTDDIAVARQIASRSRELNEVRKAMQQSVVAQAVAQGRELLSFHPALPLLVLANLDWLPGVAGPAASRVVEQLARSTILLGPDNAPGRWKGSGRAHNSDNLGAWVKTVKQLDAIERGGGHAAAVGVELKDEQMQTLRDMAQNLPMPQVAEHAPESEIIGLLDELRPEEWLQVVDVIEPTGPGNPAPLIAAPNARLVGTPVELKLKSTGQPWAMKADFAVGRFRLGVVWNDHQKAAALWKQDALLDLELELSAKILNGRTYYNWSAVRCSPASVASARA